MALTYFTFLINNAQILKHNSETGDDATCNLPAAVIIYIIFLAFAVIYIPVARVVSSFGSYLAVWLMWCLIPSFFVLAYCYIKYHYWNSVNASKKLPDDNREPIYVEHL